MLVIRHQMRGGSVERRQKEGHVIRIYRVMLEVIFAMFFVTEVHLFADGNGRIARIMMNAERH